MLAGLRIENVVLIKRLSLEFKQGLCVLTGETGAGKSILLDALGLALGVRAESELIRKGTEKAQVSAEFTVRDKHPVFLILKEAGLVEEPPLILRRSVNTDGRSKAYINDQPVSVGLLRTVGETLVEIHGQFESRGLLNPSTHRALLDEFAGLDNGLAVCWDAWKSAETMLEDLKAGAEKNREEEEYLRQSIEDLDALDPKQNEEEELAARRERLMHREKVLEALNAAYQLLSDEKDPLAQALAALDKVAVKMGKDGRAIIDPLERAAAESAEALTAIQTLSTDLQESENDLESVDDRLFALRAQARKHQCAVDDLPAVRTELAARLDGIAHQDDLIAAKIKDVDTARNAYEKEAVRISEKRRKAAEKLDKAVAAELAPLKLGKASFVTAVEALEEENWGPQGMDKVRFLVATNPGSDPGPLNKIASGGEMARFMLALKVVMAQTGNAATLIFDEVDAGIGGAVADAVGERLARLAQNCQVMVVTHSPQVAARAAHHWLVSKEGKDALFTTVVPLPHGQKRREEIARMLSGANITEEARAAAEKLMESHAD